MSQSTQQGIRPSKHTDPIYFGIPGGNVIGAHYSSICTYHFKYSPKIWRKNVIKKSSDVYYTFQVFVFLMINNESAEDKAGRRKIERGHVALNEVRDKVMNQGLEEMDFH